MIWMSGFPQIVKDSCIVSRLMDDIVAHAVILYSVLCLILFFLFHLVHRTYFPKYTKHFLIFLERKHLPQMHQT